MTLKDPIATDKDKLASNAIVIEGLRELLRDIYDVVKSSEPISDGLLSRIRVQMASGRNR